MDNILQFLVNTGINTLKVKNRFFQNTINEWKPGEPLKLLLLGYSGARNTGADMRVQEMIRQFYTLFKDSIELSITTIDKNLTKGYFHPAKQLTIPVVYPSFLYKTCPRYHGIIACEGSMFKSQFADALSIYLSGGLGYANAEGKVSVGYGGEAGAMNTSLQRFVRKHCKDSFIITRNEASRTVLKSLDIKTNLGTDTAWTFEPLPLGEGKKIIQNTGWDGKKRIIAACPINPFWWPVKPNLSKLLAKTLLGKYHFEHYKSVYFHEWSQADKDKFQTYLNGFAAAVDRYARENDCYVIIVGMEQLDRVACTIFSQKLSSPHAVFTSNKFTMFELVSILRNASLVISSRYHAIVSTMPSLIPSAGITMDERIKNIMEEREDLDLCLRVDEPDLSEKAYEILKKADTDRDVITEHIGTTVIRQLKRMGEMGMYLTDEICRVYPRFKRPELTTNWQDYLPSLSDNLKKIIKKYS
jgi:polysaccharide pyruvyl transferase WcaK-like protein